MLSETAQQGSQNHQKEHQLDFRPHHILLVQKQLAEARLDAEVLQGHVNGTPQPLFVHFQIRLELCGRKVPYVAVPLFLHAWAHMVPVRLADVQEFLVVIRVPFLNAGFDQLIKPFVNDGRKLVQDHRAPDG